MLQGEAAHRYLFASMLSLLDTRGLSYCLQGSDFWAPSLASCDANCSQASEIAFPLLWLISADDSTKMKKANRHFHARMWLLVCSRLHSVYLHMLQGVKVVLATAKMAWVVALVYMVMSVLVTIGYSNLGQKSATDLDDRKPKPCRRVFGLLYSL